METDLEPQSPALKKETDRTPFILTWTPPPQTSSPQHSPGTTSTVQSLAGLNPALISGHNWAGCHANV